MAHLTLKPSRQSIPLILGYGLFALVCLGVFCVLTFPYASLEQRLEQVLSEETGLSFSIDHLHFGLPFGLSFDSLSVRTWRSVEQSEVHLEDGSVRLNPFLLLTNRLKATLQGSILDGRLWLQARTAVMGPHLPLSLQTRWDSVDITKLAWLWSESSDINSIAGTVSGQSVLTITGQQVSGLKGSGFVEMDQARADLSIFNINSVALDSLAGKASWTLQEGELLVNRCDLQGKGIQGDMHGTLSLTPRWERSRLNFEGELAITQAQPQLYSMVRQYFNDRNIAFILKGTVHSPVVRTK